MAGQGGPVLQLSLFETADKRHTNYMALYDLAPRFVTRVERKDGSAYLNVIKRDFTFNGEPYRLVVTPARIQDAQGNERDMLPGEREQLVEDVIRKFSAQKMHLGDQDEVQTPFSVYGIHNELSKHHHTFSKAEIKEALFILNMSNIQIMKLSADGEKKPKAIVSAPAFPVLSLREDNETAFVQLNPLLAAAIKTLAFEPVNYDWMMQLRSPLPRWVFKSVSLLMAENELPSGTMEIRASEIISSFGQARARWREMLGEVEKAIVKLQEIEMVSDYEKRDLKQGRRKVDTVFSVKFSSRFLDDRRFARRQGEFVHAEAMKRAGRRNPTKFVPISDSDAAEITMARRSLAATERTLLPN